MADDETSQTKERLTAERILDGALVLADQIGMSAFTIRKLANALDTKPMTIYHHIPNKESIIDGMVDRVFAEIDQPPEELAWLPAMRHRCNSARAVLAKHPWAAPLMDSRTNPGPETLAHHNAVLGCMRRGGLSLQMTAHAYALLDSYIYGFALQESTLPATGGEEIADITNAMAQSTDPTLYPHLMELTVDHLLKPGYDFGHEFEFGLDLILNGISAAAVT